MPQLPYSPTLDNHSDCCLEWFNYSDKWGRKKIRMRYISAVSGGIVQVRLHFLLHMMNNN